MKQVCKGAQLTYVCCGMHVAQQVALCIASLSAGRRVLSLLTLLKVCLRYMSVLVIWTRNGYSPIYAVSKTAPITCCVQLACRWADAKRMSHNPVTCVYCRAPWPDAAAGATSPGGGAYINLAQVSSAHAGADTSLEALYGANAMWIHTHAGGRSRGNAARMWRRGY